jgi:hypothetical protein
LSWYCPVCNGLLQASAGCPQCAGELSDGGRISDYFAPYSPYRPIDDMKMTDGFIDHATHECIHYMYCDQCRDSFPMAIKEWKY